MTDPTIESLLFEDESAVLDFKRDQYAFEGATDDAKSELLYVPPPDLQIRPFPIVPGSVQPDFLHTKR